MKYLNPEDPEFTAKALGETIDEQSNSEIPEEFREEFDALQQFAESVRESVAGKQTGGNLGDKRVAKIQASMPKKTRVIPFPYWGGAIAAALIVMLVLPLYRPAVEEQMIDTNPVKPPTVQKQDADPVSGKKEPIPQVHESMSVLGDLGTEGRGTPSDNRVLSQFGIETDESRDVEPLIGTRVSLDSEILNAPDPMVPGKRQNQTVAIDPALPVQYAKTEEKESMNRELIPVVSPAKPRQESEPVMALDEVSEDKYELSPFGGVSGNATGYYGSNTLAGTRVRTDLKGAGILDQSGKQPVKYETLNAPKVKMMPGPAMEMQRQEVFNREAYAHIEENTFKSPMDVPLSTFSIDVDTASYSNVRRMLNFGLLPQPDAVRIEEMVNYFRYRYQPPVEEKPFAVHIDSADAPWQPEHRLVRIALKGKELTKAERPAANLVFLVDVSGSMDEPNKLPLVIDSLSLLVEQMTGEDRIAIVVYAGASGLVLPSTTANNQETILHALSKLHAGGSTNGGAGIELAYREAEKHFIKGDAINRVILCTDGDFNVGTTDQGSLVRLIEKKAKSGVFFSAIGFGSGNYQDSTMEQLSNKGNGNYAYIDSVAEARKVFVSDMLGTLVTIAKDVKIQVEFNPAKVQSYRLIGYENRALAKEDFNDDKKDAGEIGAGHSVTALYEVVPVGVESDDRIPVDDLKYQSNPKTNAGNDSSEWLTVKLRYKLPDEDTSKLIEVPFADDGDTLAQQDDDFRFATGIAAFAMKLRGSDYVGDYSYDDIHELLRTSTGSDTDGLRSEALTLVQQAADLTSQE